MNKSKLIQELGLEILDMLEKERDTLKSKLHPMNLQFKSEDEVSFMEGSCVQAKKSYSMVYSLLNTKYNQALIDEGSK